MSAMQLNTITSPDEAIAAMIGQLLPVDAEVIDAATAAGRITAAPITTDRPSPAADVSAMDGYAVRMNDVAPGRRLDVADTVLAGHPAPPMPIGLAVRIMTGAVVPAGAEAVIKREDVDEADDHIVLRDADAVQARQNIRYAGENLAAGATVIEPGRIITPATIAAMVTFGVARPRVYRPLRVGIVVTGDELIAVDQPVAPHQIRDSNGPALTAMFAPVAWARCSQPVHAPDQSALLVASLAQQLDRCDVLLITGGVSAGAADFVPAALREVGCRIVFHKLPIRPGRPLLGAIGPAGQAVFGLPGNPLSVMTTARRIAMPVLAHRAGCSAPRPPAPVVSLREPDDRTLSLHWFRPVRLIGDGEAELVESRGSGDIPSAARSDGFIEIPPDQTGPGPWPFYPWGIS